MHTNAIETAPGHASSIFSSAVRAWFEATYPDGPTPAQALAWPAIAAQEHVLLVSPTGSGKTLAAFLAILDELHREAAESRLAASLRCVYVSPLRSLNYDIERNLRAPLEGIRRQLGLDQSPIRVGVRTGDTSPHERRRLRDQPPHILITTPESLSLLLSQAAWRERWRGVTHLVIDEVHALAPTKRGADLSVSLERLTEHTVLAPRRIGLSATCRAGDSAALYLVGPTRACRVLYAPAPPHAQAPTIQVESLIEPGEQGHRGLAHRRLITRLRQLAAHERTTVVFANIRAMTEKIILDLRLEALARGEDDSVYAAHHSALDRERRRQIERALQEGRLRIAATSTSLELGVDIGTIDVAVQLGLPGGVSRWLQRLGRSGRRQGAQPRGILLTSTPAELMGAIVTAWAARRGEIEPTRIIPAPLDVVCQQLVGMACAGEQSVDDAYRILLRSGSMSTLERRDFERCLAFLAGELGSPASAFEPSQGAPPRTTAPRLWSRNGWFGVRSPRVVRWFRANVGTIHTEESARVFSGGAALGSVESAYAERLARGDRFVLDGRALEVVKVESGAIHVKLTSNEAYLPRWTSDRPSLTRELAALVATFRLEAGRILLEQGALALELWLEDRLSTSGSAARLLLDLFESQVRVSEIPAIDDVLVESSPGPSDETVLHAFHVPLHRAACEALARAVAARYGRVLGRNLSISVADLGWSIEIPAEIADTIPEGLMEQALDPRGFQTDVLEGLDRGELVARRFQRVAATALMVLKNPEPGRRVRVGGLNWVAARLYPLVKATCPDHPLIQEATREVLEDLLDLPTALEWLGKRPRLRQRRLASASPFTLAWIDPGRSEPIVFESSADALKRLQSRLTAAARGGTP